MKSFGWIPLLALVLFCLPAPAESTYPSKSVAHWDLSVSKEQNDPDYEKVRSLVEAKKYSQALILLEQKHRELPSEMTPVVLKAFVLNEMGEYKDALNTVLGGYKEMRRHPAVHFAFCQIHRNLGHGETSRRGCEIAAEQNPKAPETHYELARTLSTLGEMRDANSELARAAELDPKNPLYPFERGMNFFYLNDNANAEKAFLKALEADPKHLESSYQLGYLMAAEGKTDAARKYLKPVIQSGKNHPDVQSAHLLMDYVNKGETDKLPLKVVPHDYHLGRSKALYQSGDYGPALIEIETAARLKPDNLQIQEILVGLYSILLRVTESEKAVTHLIDIAKDNPETQAKGFQELGDLQILRGNLKEAHNNYEKARGLADPNKIAQISLDEFPEDLSSPPSNFDPNELYIKPTEALNRKGEVFAHYGMHNRAIANYSLVVRMDSNHLMAMLNTAASYHLSGQNNRAISILERLLISHPNHEHIIAHRILLAKAYLKSGNMGETFKNLEVIMQINPSARQAILKDPAFKEIQDHEAFKKIIH